MYDVTYCNECGGENPQIVTRTIRGNDRDDDTTEVETLGCDHSRTGREGYPNVEFVYIYKDNATDATE